MLEAILYRVFKRLPEDRVVSEAAFERLTLNADSPFLLREFLEETTEWMSVEDWIQSMPGRRRKMLQRAMLEREARGQNHPEYDTITPFVKTELLPHLLQPLHKRLEERARVQVCLIIGRLN